MNGPAHPTIVTRVVIFTIRDERLLLLLLGSGDGWALPGAALTDEDLDASAMRALAAGAVTHDLYLEQLYTFANGAGASEANSVVVAYYALAPSSHLALKDAAASWFPLDALPMLPTSQEAIVRLAHSRLAGKLDYSTIALKFMPEAFTLSELQAVYEVILGERLDKRNFRKRVLGGGHVEDTGRTWRNGGHRPARLYRARCTEVEFIR